MDRRHCNRSNISTCRLCSVGMLEDCNHLFFSSPFSARCWNKIGIQWKLTVDLKDIIIHARNSFRGPAFMLIFTCATWHIWKQRNDLVFDREPYSFRRWFICFRQELVYHYPKLKENIRLAISDWLNLIDNSLSYSFFQKKTLMKAWTSSQLIC
ncbi:hypothetical protein BRADI_2g28107v3 [Brachypodium distachyon]|uniref:Reverse transcriptase zinc-binding domain-containing protein n=1 Tax=Brachypodium distachyon TaxID=15368 RepID=A0A2K2DB23_BRADI|nr:hypothetical protein BRADI_2g28107v3 [Brachypodium distachyon]